jgi:glycosyltransferase involved in cell wall biosynthesis
VRLWDRAAADRVDEYIANSRTVAKRIKKYYKSDSVVINPPVEVDNFEIDHTKGEENYFLTGCRLTPYKRMDLVVEAFKKNNKNLKIFGDGPDMKRLKKIAGGSDNIQFLGRVSDEQLKKLYSRCSAFLNPQEEDFGITCVEAMASGRPVIAYRAGGARETIIENKTGVFFDTQDIDSLNQAIDKYYDIKFNPEEIKEHAEHFSKENFKKQIKEFIAEKYNEFQAS